MSQILYLGVSLQSDIPRAEYPKSGRLDSLGKAKVLIKTPRIYCGAPTCFHTAMSRPYQDNRDAMEIDDDFGLVISI